MPTWRLSGDSLKAFVVEVDFPTEPDLEDEAVREVVARELDLNDYRGKDDFRISEVIELDDAGQEIEVASISVEPSFSRGRYGLETIIINQATGMQLRSETAENSPDGCSYLRVCDPAGREIAYWNSEEWQADPQLVIGAVIGALCQTTHATVDGAGAELDAAGSDS